MNANIHRVVIIIIIIIINILAARNSDAVVDLLDGGVAGERLVAAGVEGVFVIVHPDLEHAFINTDLAAEVAHLVLVALLNLPADTVGELVHLVFLSLAELSPEPLPGAWSMVVVVVVSGEVVGREVEI